MFQTSISLEDQQIELALVAVHDWCASANCSLDSGAGRHDGYRGSRSSGVDGKYICSGLAAHLSVG